MLFRLVLVSLVSSTVAQDLGVPLSWRVRIALYPAIMR
jgi:hypothetical protein